MYRMTSTVPAYAQPNSFEDSTAPSPTVATAVRRSALCALGHVELPPQAGFADYGRGPSGRLAAARVYDDVQASVEDS
jgi:hypothetical protein